MLVGSVPCPVCSQNAHAEATSGDTVRYRCPRCGDYTLAGTAAAVLPGKLSDGTLDRSVLSHLLRRSFESGNTPRQLFESDLDGLADFERPNPREQRDNLIRWLGSQQKNPEDLISVERHRLAAIVGCAVA